LQILVKFLTIVTIVTDITWCIQKTGRRYKNGRPGNIESRKNSSPYYWKCATLPNRRFKKTI